MLAEAEWKKDADPNQIIVRHYLFSQFYSLIIMICKQHFLMLYMAEF